MKNNKICKRFACCYGMRDGCVVGGFGGRFEGKGECPYKTNVKLSCDPRCDWCARKFDCSRELNKKELYEKGEKSWNTRVSPWKTLDDEVPPLNEIVLIKLSAGSMYLHGTEESKGIIQAYLYKCTDESLIFYDYPLNDSYKLNEIEKWMKIPGITE